MLAQRRTKAKLYFFTGKSDSNLNAVRIRGVILNVGKSLDFVIEIEMSTKCYVMIRFMAKLRLLKSPPPPQGKGNQCRLWRKCRVMQKNVHKSTLHKKYAEQIISTSKELNLLAPASPLCSIFLNTLVLNKIFIFYCL